MRYRCRLEPWDWTEIVADTVEEAQAKYLVYIGAISTDRGIECQQLSEDGDPLVNEDEELSSEELAAARADARAN